MTQFIFRGEFSKGLNTNTVMAVTFEGREPVEVTDAAAVNWFNGHPDYARVAEEPVAEPPVRRILSGTPKPMKAPAKKRAKAKK
jgi:hypothetical protein